jgi:hypothetical protein
MPQTVITHIQTIGGEFFSTIDPVASYASQDDTSVFFKCLYKASITVKESLRVSAFNSPF